MPSLNRQMITKRRALILAVMLVLAVAAGIVYFASNRGPFTPAEDLTIQQSGAPSKPAHFVALSSVVGKPLKDALADLRRTQGDGNVEIVAVPEGAATVRGSGTDGLVVTAACANGAKPGASTVRLFFGVAQADAVGDGATLKTPEVFARNGFLLANFKPDCDLGVASISVED